MTFTIRDSDISYHNLFRTMTQGVVYQNAAGKIIAANSAAEKILGLTFDQMTGRTSLRGILPLCSYCKKIRDDQGYWEQVDVYINKHTQADISHSICPACAKEHYPGMDIYEE